MAKLLLDIGNTRCALAESFDGSIKTVHHFSSMEMLAPLAIEEQIKSFVNPEEFQEIAVSCVIPKLQEAFLSLDRFCGRSLFVVRPEGRKSYQIKIDKPETLGPDRLADVEAMLRIYGTPSICVDLGTATTFGVLDADQNFLGGIIAPGLKISEEALFGRAAALYVPSGHMPKTWIGNNTDEAMLLGTQKAHAKMIEAVLNEMEQELGVTCKKVITGGALSLLQPFFPCDRYHLDECLTLKGIEYLSEFEHGKSKS